MHIHRIGDVTVLNDHAEVPGLGFLPVNAYVLHAEQPMVIDTGLSTADKDFVSDLAKVIDPADVRWPGLHIPTATTPAVCGSSSRLRRKPA
jgi:flavorubredoxin